MISHDFGIYTIDADYLRPSFASIHLVIENGKVAIVDTGCNDSLRNAHAALEQLGLSSDAVDYIFLTHIHLDHAGGAGVMMKAFRNAQLVVHPRGARHMADPSKLVEGATAVYGAEAVRRLYGEVLPVDASRIIQATHGMCISLGSRRFLCLDTPGHAKHHIGIVDQKSGHIFSGDTFGVSYRELDTDGRQFVFPATTPIQFDPEEMHESIDMILDFKPEALYLSHFGQLRDVEQKAFELHRSIDAYVAIAQRENHDAPARHVRILRALESLLIEEVTRFGCKLAPRRVVELFSNDLALNAQGLGVWLDTQKP